LAVWGHMSVKAASKTLVKLTPEFLIVDKYSGIFIPNFSRIFLMVVWYRLEPIFTTAPAASKNNAQFKYGQM